MAYLIGTDEAGYGPNLGPLVVTATVWRVPDEFLHADLYPILAQVIASKPSADSSSKVVIADSKSLYKPGGSLALLERGVFAMLGATGKSVDDWSSVFEAFDDNVAGVLAHIPWYADFQTTIPIDANVDDIEKLTRRVREGSESAGVMCEHMRSRVVVAKEFNELIVMHGNKASALSQVTLGLVKSLVAPLGDERILIHCDKHGGRSKYAPLLQPLFPEYLIEVCGEGRMESVYRWGPQSCRMEARFVAKGESCIASALASMVSKYLRELAMRAFNEFWRRQLRGLRPTAGYPVDARRFKDEIAGVQQDLEIADDLLWRSR